MSPFSPLLSFWLLPLSELLRERLLLRNTFGSRRMKRIVYVLLFLGIASSAAFSATSLHFSLPKGWLDCSPGVPAATLSVLKPEVVKELQGNGNVFAAVDLSSKSQHLLTSVFVREKDVQMNI